jgi:RHS repeat-associated protein
MFAIHSDHLGTPRVITDKDKRVVWKAQLKPFGEMAVEIEEITHHQRFPGQRYDIESRLHYNYFRDYDPSLGRYIQSDPMGLLDGLNTYTYVGGNSLMYTDPYGLARVCYRPLDSVLTPIIIGRAGSQADRDNNIVGHQHILYNDGTNIGFGPDGLFEENGREGEYSMCGEELDDKRLKEAVRVTPPGDYDFFIRNNNCQDWIDHVMEAY